MTREATVFVVDDDQAVRDSLVLLLQSEGIAVEAFASAEAFLETYQADRPGCLVLDISMPGMSGLELQANLAAKHLRIPIIFITGHGDVPMSVRAVKAGALDFIEKPFDNQRLLDRIRVAIARDVQIRREELRHIADANRIYAESIVETVREPLLVLDDSLKILSANSSFYETFKVSRADAHGKQFDEFMSHLWDFDSLRMRVAAVFANGTEIRDLEIGFDSPTTGHRSLLLNARQLLQREDQPKCVLLAMEDVSGRKQAEEKARALLESAPDAIVVVNGKGQISLINEQTERLFGYLREELIGQGVETLIPGRFHEMHEAAVGGYLDAPYTRPMGNGRSLSGRHKDGHEVPVEIHLSPFQSDEGLLVAGTIRDITDRKKAEEALFQEKERAQVTLHSIGEAVITTDARGVVEFLNPIAEQLTGWSNSEARGQPVERVFNVIDERSHGCATDPVSRCLQDGEAVGFGDCTILNNRDGQRFGIEVSAAPIRGRMQELLGAVMVFKDVTEQRRMARELAHHAIHDPLTGLVNRREFEKRLEHAVASNKAHATRHALCYLDLDQFKIVNDTAGHPAGDELLRQVTALFLDKVRDRDTLARLGGDEFGLLLDNCPMDKAFEIAEALVAEVRDFRFVWEERPFRIGASIGLVRVTGETESAAELLSRADVACYTAKELGRNRVHVYKLEDSEPARRHTEMIRAADLSSALEQDRFMLYWQPIVPLRYDREETTHYELLVRLLGDGGEIVMPGAFIPAAERYGLMVAVDRWVIHSAFHGYSRMFMNQPGAEIAINLSGNSLNDESLLTYVRRQFAESAMPPERVCFEITETAAIHNLNQVRQFIKELKKDGCRFALDDFGSGLSSFTYLKKLPVDYLKIEGSFVRDMLDSPLDQAMVEAINKIGHTLGMRIVAESAESEAVIKRLRDMGVDYAQGFALRSPSPLEDLAA